MISLRHSIATRLLAITFAIYFLVALSVTLAHMKFEYDQAKENIIADLKVFHKTFQPILSQMVWSINRDALHKTVAGIAEAPTIAGVRIIALGIEEISVGTIANDQGKVIQVSRLNKPAFWDHADNDDSVFGYEFSIVYKSSDGREEMLGKGIFYSSDAIVFQRVKYGFALIIVNSIIKTSALWLIFSWLSNRLLRQPLCALTSAVQQVDFEHLDQIKIDIQTHGRNELKVLEEAFNGMTHKLSMARYELKQVNQLLEQKVEARTEQLQEALQLQRSISQELQEKGLVLDQFCRALEERSLALSESNRTLELTLDNLRTTQDQLIQSEKMASLGQLVAGVAHELNTPIGNALITATNLEDAAREIHQCMLDDKLRKSKLNHFISSSVAMSELISKSCTRAANLITSFKQVAVDQASEQRRSFKLQALVEDNIAALRPSFRKAPWVIEIAVADDIVFDSYPGPMGQVITNLVQNAVFHGFDGREQGCVVVAAKATATGDSVEITVIDDGNGMSQEVLAHIFEPFYTTRLGQGGSGLGLSIVLNIVVGMLGGTLSATSELGRGTCMTLIIPLIAPRREVQRGSDKTDDEVN